MQAVDVAVIGAGVVGCAVARELSRYRLDVLVLECAHDVGEGSSKANSGIVHVGFQPRAGSLKGRSCVEGNALLRTAARELEVPLVSCGGMMVAFDDAGLEKLREKAARAYGNGAGELPIVDGDEARRLEPRLSGRVTHAMLAPQTAVISPFDLVWAMAQNAYANGVEFWFNAAVQTLVRDGDAWELACADGRGVRARFVVNCAGDRAHELDAQVHPMDYVVRPRAGDFIVFDRQDPARAIRHVIYQAAQTDEGGTLVAPTVEGNLLAGPTSRNVRSFGHAASSAQGLEHVRRVAAKLIPDLDFSNVITNFAGVRTNIVNVPKELKDFVVRASAPGFVSTLGIKNPGLTSSIALAQRAVALLGNEGVELAADPSFDAHRRRYVPFLQRDAAEQRRLLVQNPAYRHVVCRCEGITQGDVEAIMRQPLAPTTMAGVKRRLRCGMGRCQGGYCAPQVAQIMAHQQGCQMSELVAGEYGGRLVVGRAK